MSRPNQLFRTKNRVPVAKKLILVLTCFLFFTNCQPKKDSIEPFLLFLLTQPNPNCIANPNRVPRATVTEGGFSWETGLVEPGIGNGDSYVLKRGDSSPIWCLFYDQTTVDTSGTKIGFLVSDLFVAFSVKEPNSNFVPTAGALQTNFLKGSGQSITFLTKLNPETGAILRSTFLKASNASGIATSFLVNTILVLGDRVVLSATTGEDAGIAEDSLDRGKSCLAGRTQELEINLDLTELVAINCR